MTIGESMPATSGRVLAAYTKRMFPQKIRLYDHHIRSREVNAI